MSINDSCKQQIRITLKLWKSDGKIKVYHSSKTRRIIAKVKADKFLKARLKVFYGKFPDHRGKLTTFFNDGIYTNEKDFNLALKAFLEE